MATELVQQQPDRSQMEPDVLTDKQPTKTLPCVMCQRPCVVTLFYTASKVKCTDCKDSIKRDRQENLRVEAAHTVNPAKLENLKDAIINNAFQQQPLCPFDPEHPMELKSVTHSPNYGPRHLVGYDVKGMPRYEQETGESVLYQCGECRATVSFSTMHPLMLKAQNESRRVDRSGPGWFETSLGTREPDLMAVQQESDEDTD